MAWRQITEGIIAAARKLWPQPGMAGTPPSARPAISADPAEHAEDFGRRYAEPMEYHVIERMTELGLPEERIGYHDQGGWHAFFTDTCKGGVVVGDRIGVDTGVFNTDLLEPDYGEETGKPFGRSRLRDRLDAIIAHEHAESVCGSHAEALEQAPKTELPIRERAREILRAMEKTRRR
jgi:hypothetical protein